MPFHIIRPATEEDTARFEAAKTRFEACYGFNPEMEDGEQDVYIPSEGRTMYREEVAAALRNWRKAARRALRHPMAESIAYGYVGYSE